MKSLLYFLISSSLLLTSCSKKLTYFSDRLQNENNWSEAELKRIQFYVSQDIVLYKSTSSGGSKIEDGQIQIKDNSNVKQVVIKKGTPGILVFSPKDDRFAVSFDDDSDKYLMFGPSDRNNGRYTLLAKNWNRRSGIIRYGGQEYRTNSESAYAALMVDIKRASDANYKKETAGGRKVRR